MFVTVSGPPGSGKSTTASALAEHFGLEHTSGGDIFRGLAEEKGISLAELNTRAETDPAIDRDLDRRLNEIATDAEDLVLESRLAGWLAGEHADFRIWLDAPVDVRARRIAEREDKAVDVAREETVEREASEAQRYREYYDIDVGDLSIYDLTVNTARWSEADVPALLASAIERYDAEGDEGQVPVGSVL